MVPAFRSPRIVLGLVAAMQIGSGVALTFFCHEFFKLLQIPRPAILLPFQIWGAMGIMMGLGIVAIIERPLRHRAVLRLIMACKFVAGVACLLATVVKGLDASFALAGFLLELAPAAGIMSVLVELSLLRESRWEPRFWRVFLGIYAPLAPLVFLLCITLGVGSLPVLESARSYGWLAEVAVTDMEPVREIKSIKEIVWKRLPSAFPMTGGAGLEYRLAPALGGLKFTDPVAMLELPDDSRRYLVTERTGKVVLVTGMTKSIFLDLRAGVHYGPFSPEEGLLNFVLHPGYADPASKGFHSVFAYYTRMWEGKSCNCLARFRVTDDGNSVDASTEEILFCQGYSIAVHHGGGLAFGPDGFLYVGVGDGFWGAPNLNAQRIDKGFHSGILRIDVDRQGGEVSHPIRRAPENGASFNYMAPNDNPFLSPDGARLEEFFAIGFRNPWRISFDRKSGELWVADSGFEHREEINRVAKGDNGGWAYLEGSVSTRTIHDQHLPRPEKLLGREIAPVYEYPRSVSFCTVGGFLYRGKALPELEGKFVFGDVSGQVAALCLDAEGKFEKKISIGTVPQPLMALCSLAEDAAGELYVLSTKEISKEEGVIYKIERGPSQANAEIPRKLSETKLFADLKNLTPDAALTPYEIIVPFWSDHAIKSRFVGTQLGYQVRGKPGQLLEIPPGTIFVKHFDFPTDLRSPQQTRRLETRVLVFTVDRGWYGLTYRWNAEGTDAELVDDAEQETLLVTQLDGSIREQLWTFPDRHSCLACHNAVSDGALGFSYRQLSMFDAKFHDPIPNAPYEAKDQGNQLERMRDRGIFTREALACDLNDLRPLAATNDESRSLEDRARSYLDANCSYCHRNGVWYSSFDVRYEIPLADSQLMSERLLKHFTDSTNGKPVSDANPAWAIKPGLPQDSFLHRRMNTTEVGRRMPPIGREVVDEQGADVVREWILSMKKPEEGAARSAVKPAEGVLSQEPVSK